MNVISGIQGQGYSGYSKLMLHQHLEGYDKAMAFFNKVKLGFDGIETVEQEIDDSIFPPDIARCCKGGTVQRVKRKRNINLYSLHKVYGKQGAVVGTTKFDISEESDGTRN